MPVSKQEAARREALKRWGLARHYGARCDSDEAKLVVKLFRREREREARAATRRLANEGLSPRLEEIRELADAVFLRHLESYIGPWRLFGTYAVQTIRTELDVRVQELLAHIDAPQQASSTDEVRLPVPIRQVRKAIAALPDPLDQRLARLFLLRRLTFEEISRLVRMTVEAVRERLESLSSTLSNYLQAA